MVKATIANDTVRAESGALHYMKGEVELESKLPGGKIIGGSSSVNGQVFFRGIPEDYDEWEELGNKGWSYLNVLKYFRKSENDLTFGSDDFHGNEGPIPVRRYSDNDLMPSSKAFLQACMSQGY